MPVVEVHLVAGAHDDAAVATLLARLSHAYAEVLSSPVGRIRAAVTLRAPEHWAVGGVTGGDAAPYFTAVVLEGRPVEQRHRLLATFTDLVVETLGVDRSRVRGRIVQVPPDDWAVGGVPAATARRAEIADRERVAGPGG